MTGHERDPEGPHTDGAGSTGRAGSMNGAGSTATRPRGTGHFRRRYGEGPLHLLLLAATFALTGYAGVRLLDGDTLRIVLWFAGAAVVHDLVLLPLYSTADRALREALGTRPANDGSSKTRSGGGRVNFVRVPAFLSLLLLVVQFPLIARLSERYERYTGLSVDVFLGNWLLVTGVLFAVSALWFVLSMWRGSGRASRRRRATKGRPSDSH